MSVKLVIIGAGGFGRETIDVVRAINKSRSLEVFELIGVADSSPSQANLDRLRALDVPYLGTIDHFANSCDSAAVRYVVAIGSPQARCRIVRHLTDRNITATTLIHPSATLGSNVMISAGVIICAGVIVSTNVRIGAHSHLNPGCIIGHDTKFHQFVSVNPAATISGGVALEQQCLVGAGSTVLQGLKVGESAIVGAGAVVVKDVPGKTVVKGIPAR